MNHQECIKQSRQTKALPPDKFDRHMARARNNDIASRKCIFDLQTNIGVDRHAQRKNIKSSIY
jgi:hypothetical protein